MDQHSARGASVPLLSVATHGAMLAGMVWAMTGGHGSARALPAAAGLIAVSLALAPLLRRRAAVRDHVLDLWAMAGLLLVPVFAGASTRPAAAMPRMPGMAPFALAAVPLAAAVGLSWAGLRVWSMRAHTITRPAGTGASLVECAITAGLTGTGLLAMAVL